MKSKHCWYGLLGFLSLLGFLGFLTENKGFFAFFAFAVNFEYFFIKSDEMLEEYMNRSAARGFCCGMITTAAVALVAFFLYGQAGNQALLSGVTLGWAASVVVYSLSTAYYGIREKRGLTDDKE